MCATTLYLRAAYDKKDKRRVANARLLNFTCTHHLHLAHGVQLVKAKYDSI